MGRWSELPSRSYQWKKFRDGALALIDSLTDNENPESAIRRTLVTEETDEPWIQDIIRYGAVFLRDSCKKVQQYYGDGVFVFAGDNWTEQAILLGGIAKSRNLLGERLTVGEQPSWEIEADWRRLPIGEPSQPVFYKGYLLIEARQTGPD